MVVVTTQRGPWKLCPNFDCPGKERREAEKKARAAERAAAKAEGGKAKGARGSRKKKS
jgi:DNA topoisomerase-1